MAIIKFFRSLPKSLLGGILLLFLAGVFANAVPTLHAELLFLDGVVPTFLLWDLVSDGEINAWYLDIPENPYLKIISPVYLDLILPAIALLLFWAIRPPRTTKRLLARLFLVFLIPLILILLPILIGIFLSTTLFAPPPFSDVPGIDPTYFQQ
ncbi:MAG: hypothetical protein A2806_04270 [Candidatus Terrybacteria bacterium RIFCSPHIGHO2_01_FULL_48_17]|uniref:Uncharacterized protein n=1 Tax=Candidatus Terrybacteria bacterium RIFCSPHIGHO2_01_FULL_48_17 TaxID=1802362 RepID=A0A1G2PMM0_9BACT|nr:MAG: hypothetical protein A2806_04270 [Candidatus Terrybacteria bacterium RIFCSPHIGHO2_01_FULL_48_17]OHA53712.1 MAG: hypothetical protein A3A30_05065 [Candidatus Terrybacteria bacterium RIFCSPLOWO2_01_FULL_48_14]